MKNILVDTSIVIDYLRSKDKQATLLYQVSKDKHRLFISMITYAELHAGKSVWEHEEARQKLHKIFAGMGIIPLDRNIAEQAGKIRTQHGLSLLDAILAATALRNKMELVTRNGKDFRDVQGLTIFEPVASIS